MFNIFNLFKPKNPIAQLRSSNKDQWCAKYFPEYYELFDGYPASIPVVYGDPDDDGPKVLGLTRPVELAPWEYFDGKDGSIDQSGNRWSVEYDLFGRKKMSKTPVTEEEFVKWCDERNYFRSGNGFDPSIFVDAVEWRGSQWRVNRDLYLSELVAKGKETTHPTKPDHISCPHGVFYDEAGPSSVNPWGVNAFYIPSGAKEPTYISKRWGPDYATDEAQLAGAPVVQYYDETRDGPRPSQEEYDRIRYSVWI